MAKVDVMTNLTRGNCLLGGTKTFFPYRFFLVTYIWSWGFWILIPIILSILPCPAIYKTTITLSLLVIGTFGPLSGALFCIYKEKHSVKDFLRQSLDLKLGWRGYFMPLFIFGGTTFIAWFLPELYGERRLDILLPSIWIFIPCLFYMILFGGGQEEFGWRGFILPILEKKYGIWRANILLGVIWACWHIPLWFIAGTSQRYMNFFGFVILSIGYSFILSLIRAEAGNKMFSGIYSHGVANALISIMPTIIMQDNMQQSRFWIWVFLTFTTGVLITILRFKKTEEYA